MCGAVVVVVVVVVLDVQVLVEVATSSRFRSWPAPSLSLRFRSASSTSLRFRAVSSSASLLLPRRLLLGLPAQALGLLRHASPVGGEAHEAVLDASGHAVLVEVTNPTLVFVFCL